jgi:Putative adhesin
VKITRRKNNVSLPTCLFASIFAVLFFAAMSFAQPKPKIIITDKPEVKVDVKTEIAVNESDIAAEKSLQTDPKVNISLCVDEGKITINGWNRNEIRAFVSNGSQVGFKVLQKLKDNPVGVKILGYDPQKTKNAKVRDCLVGEEIELDVPNNATINFESRESETFISNVAKIRVKNSSGDTTVRKISNGIDVTAFEGNISVEDSKGEITLTNTNGNILAFDVEANELSDIFKVKTASGSVSLKNIDYTQVDATSTSGSIRYHGGFSEGGQINFGTLNGSITLLMPIDSSCKVNATYSFGSFGSEIPFKAEQKSSGDEVKKLTAIFGKGDATINIGTYSGKISIKKQ